MPDVNGHIAALVRQNCGRNSKLILMVGARRERLIQSGPKALSVEKTGPKVCVLMSDTTLRCDSEHLVILPSLNACAFSPLTGVHATVPKATSHG